MFRCDAPGTIAVKPTPASLGTEEYFKDGTSGGGDGTTLDHDALNMWQDCLIEVLDEAGQAHSKTDYSNFYTALETVIDQRIAAANPGIEGFISGLRYTGTGALTFTISEGSCRDESDLGTMVLDSLIACDLAKEWDEADGVFPSTLTSPGTGRARIFLMQKSTDLSAVTIGIDESSAAIKLQVDGGALGYDRYRQVGWVVTGLWDADEWIQHPFNSSLYYSLDQQSVGATGSFGNTFTTQFGNMPDEGDEEVGQFMFTIADADALWEFQTHVPAVTDSEMFNIRHREWSSQQNAAGSLMVGSGTGRSYQAVPFCPSVCAPTGAHRRIMGLQFFWDREQFNPF